MISQDYTQWPFSARRNITMSDGRTDQARLERAMALSRIGAAIEHGTHEELMSNPNGHYRQLLRMQADAYQGLLEQ